MKNLDNAGRLDEDGGKYSAGDQSGEALIRYFDALAVTSLLDYPGCIAAVRAAMVALSEQDDSQPLRNIITLEPGKLFALMPGFMPDKTWFGGKLVSAFTDPARPGRSSHRGIVALFDGDTGAVAVVADAGAITHIRTGAASAVATDALARADARVLSIFGYGAQAASHVMALREIRTLDRIIVWGRNSSAGAAFCDRMQQEIDTPVEFVADARSAACEADIICTTTGSATPVLFGGWLRPGVHVNLVGSSHAGAAEADSTLVAGSRFFVDSRRAALAAAGEFLNSRSEGFVTDEHILGEIGEVLLGTVPGRREDAEITVYKSLGNVVQDLAAAAYLLERASRNTRQSSQ